MGQLTWSVRVERKEVFIRAQKRPPFQVKGFYCSDRRSRDHEVVVVTNTINMATEKLEWGGVEEGEVSL
jgi:hypothetical protein